MASALNINIFAYEYTGYGGSTGKTSDKEIVADICAAYDFLLNVLNFEWN